MAPDPPVLDKSESSTFGRPDSATIHDGRESSVSINGSDRVFPIRSVVSVNPLVNQTEATLHDCAPAPPNQADAITESTNTVPDSTISDVIDPQSVADLATSPPHAISDPYRYISSRHEHVVTENGHSVAIGGKKSIQRCEDEPIHIPGAIQSFGVLLALREESPSQLVVRMVSENSEQLLGYSPKQLFELDSFSDILNNEQTATFEEHLDYVREDGHDLHVDGPEIFLLSISLPSGDVRQFWCAAHVSQENKDMIICEFELENDGFNPLNADDQSDLAPNSEPTSTLGIKPTSAQLAASTVSASQSFRALRNARRRRGHAAAMQIFDILSSIQEQLGWANEVEPLLEITAGLVKELVGFHRVLVYQFDASWNGKVVAELMDPEVTMDLYKGLHFPASDIPAQARALYKVNKVRLLYDRDHATSRLVCRTLEDLETPLDMTYAYLRAMSPIHTQYLANMNVRSSMSISINAFGDLWGLISCHSYGSSGMRVSFPIRKLCRLIGDTVARNIERISHASTQQTRSLLNAVPKEVNPLSYIAASSDELLQLVGADSGAVSIGNESKVLASNDPQGSSSQEVLALLEYLRVRQVTSVLVSRDIAQDYPDFQYTPGLKRISGLLCVPLSTRADHFIVFFRRGQMNTITWAGNPHEIAKRKETADGGHLTPRESFKQWSETTLAQSRAWTKTDLSTAAKLGSVYGKFIKVWRQKEIIRRNSRLTRLLLANSAHEVRTPLNSIINYLEIALEGSLDEETREGLVRSHSASKSLFYIIKDLLDLTTVRPGSDQQLVKIESFDLQLTFREATDMLAGEAKRKNISYSYSMHPGLPAAVMGDQRRIRQVFVNLISNAIQHTTEGAVNVEIGPSVTDAIAGHVAVEIVVADTGSGISKAKREILFQELEQVSIDDIYAGEHEETQTNAMRQEKRVLGLGLALTARIVHTMHGKLSVKSEQGRGTRVSIMLQFPCAERSISSRSEEIPSEGVPSPDTNVLEAAIGGPNKPDDDGMLRPEDLGSEYTWSADQPVVSIHKSPPMERTTSESSPTRHPCQSIGVEGSGKPTPTSSRRSTFQRSSKSEDSEECNADSVRSTHSQITSERHLPSPNQSQVVGDDSHRASIPSTRTDRSSSVVSPSTEPSTASSISLKLNVLVAEDDPINSKLIKKRLEKVGHIVHLTSNGEACVEAFSQSNFFDVILMDIQMPIVDGMAATKIIREFEAKGSQNASSNTSLTERVPIFAVSASLEERKEELYVETGFDGWIMKPINFARLNGLLNCVRYPLARKGSRPREWESGGWFDIADIS